MCSSSSKVHFNENVMMIHADGKSIEFHTTIFSDGKKKQPKWVRDYYKSLETWMDLDKQIKLRPRNQ